MDFMWLGQAGILFEYGNIKIMIDPYLSDYCQKLNPDNYRRMPINNNIFNIQPDILLITHEHADHLDPETCKKLLNKEREITVLAPENAWKELRKYGNRHNYVMFNPGTMWTHNGIEFRAVKAEHSDRTAIGAIISIDNKHFYVTGDTLYNEEVISTVKINPDYIFLPINGVGNNMNIADAVKFAEKVKAKSCVPIHWGMFDDIDAADFNIKNKIIPKLYEKVTL